jgi:hypothetical protein
MKRKEYKGKIENLISDKIKLNIDALKPGQYELQILQKKKIIKTIYFTKK